MEIYTEHLEQPAKIDLKNLKNKIAFKNSNEITLSTTNLLVFLEIQIGNTVWGSVEGSEHRLGVVEDTGVDTDGNIIIVLESEYTGPEIPKDSRISIHRIPEPNEAGNDLTKFLTNVKGVPGIPDEYGIGVENARPGAPGAPEAQKTQEAPEAPEAPEDLYGFGSGLNPATMFEPTGTDNDTDEEKDEGPHEGSHGGSHEGSHGGTADANNYVRYRF